MSDAGRGIARIDYDRLNNPVRIQFTDGSVTRYIYSAAGEKLRVTHLTAVPNISVPIGSTRELAPSEILSADSTDYLLGGSLTLRNGRIDKLQFEEGYCQAVEYSGNASQDDFYLYYYDRDHLGNIRQVVKADRTTNGTVVQTMEYYPFGAQFCHSSTASEVQSRKYNGKELDRMHGLNTYDYGARQYTPILGRWDRMDPLCEKYYGVSPYAYCRNNPVMMVDPDGMYPIYDTKGNFLGTDASGLTGYPLIMEKTLFKQGMSCLESADAAILGEWPEGIEEKVLSHYESLKFRPDYDGFVTINEGIAWAKSHPNALKHPTPNNTLYINASLLDFGSLSTDDFKTVGKIESKDLFTNDNLLRSFGNPILMATVYALGNVNMRLIDREKGLVEIINDKATDYDWNRGGNSKRDWFVKVNNSILGIDPAIHGFKTYYYGFGILNQ